MGATVMILGPTAIAADMANQSVKRVITDGHGRFTIEHLVPGWYSLKVSSPTRFPAMRSGIRVDADETAVARFILTEIFAPVRFRHGFGAVRVIQPNASGTDGFQTRAHARTDRSGAGLIDFC